MSNTLLGSSCPIVSHWDPNLPLDVEQVVAVVPELLPLQGFGHGITLHIVRWAVFDVYFSGLDAVGDEVISDINMPRPLATRRTTIVLKQHRALVVLVDCRLSDLVSLGLQEVSSP
jgi:hypothetical protein